MKTFNITIKTLSPLHLGAGKADVIIDAEVVHDEYGMPYFPAKRLKGLLYESALELIEISNGTWFTINELKNLFGQGSDGESKFILENLYLKEYPKLRESWEYLDQTYQGIFTRQEVLDSYTELRYQTKIDKETGIADDSSLHNMRVVDAGIEFCGELELSEDTAQNQNILEKAFANLRFVGAKRNRGCGNVHCTLQERSANNAKA